MAQKDHLVIQTEGGIYLGKFVHPETSLSARNVTAFMTAS